MLDPQRDVTMKIALLLTFLLASSVVIAARISPYWLNSDVEKDATNDIEKRDTQVRDITRNQRIENIFDNLPGLAF